MHIWGWRIWVYRIKHAFWSRWWSLFSGDPGWLDALREGLLSCKVFPDFCLSQLLLHSHASLCQLSLHVIISHSESWFFNPAMSVYVDISVLATFSSEHFQFCLSLESFFVAFILDTEWTRCHKKVCHWLFSHIDPSISLDKLFHGFLSTSLALLAHSYN